MTVYFHGNFGLNRKYMAGILKGALINPNFNDRKLAEPFGYGAPFSSRYRSWLHKVGIAEQGLPMKLTPVGEVVYKKDKDFNSITTQWLMHHELTRDPERAEAWHFFANEFLPQFKSFSKNELLDALTEKLRPHSEKHFGPGSKLNQVIFRKIIECYTEDYALGNLGIIKKEGNNYNRGIPKSKQGPWKSPVELTRAY